LGTIEGGVIAVLRAYDVIGALCVVHIDAHIDWRNERDGVREGYSSVMQRVSEMPWVKDMAQGGLRGIGSARQQEVDDALAFGSTFIRAGAVHRERIDSCIEKIPAAEHYLITIDTDAFDTAIAPGVLYPTAGLPLMKPRIWCEALPSKGQLWGLT
jgi:agmatinase